MPADQQTTLMEHLRASELLEPAVLDELARLPEAAEANPSALGKVLFQRKLLSRFQITLLAQGKAAELRVGPYLILDKLGEGGMGSVYRAEHKKMGRLVALKVIRKEK